MRVLVAPRGLVRLLHQIRHRIDKPRMELVLRDAIALALARRQVGADAERERAPSAERSPSVAWVPFAEPARGRPRGRTTDEARRALIARIVRDAAAAIRRP